MLDQLTDRAGTSCLMMTLATFYPQYTFWLQLSMGIDITGHWLYLHTSMLQGKTSHKFIDMSGNPVMRLYYTNKNVLFFMCAGNEAFYAALYVMHFYTGPLGKYLDKIYSFINIYCATTGQRSPSQKWSHHYYGGIRLNYHTYLMRISDHKPELFAKFETYFCSSRDLKIMTTRPTGLWIVFC